MRFAKVCLTFLVIVPALSLGAADDSWPPLPKGALTIKNLGPRPGVKNVKTKSVEVSRDGKRVASITKDDRDAFFRASAHAISPILEKFKH